MSFGPEYTPLNGEGRVQYFLNISTRWTPASSTDPYVRASVGGVMQLQGGYSGEEANDASTPAGAAVVAEMDAKVQDLVNRLDAATADTDWDFSWSYKNLTTYQDITPDED